MRILQVISYGYIAGGAEKSVALLKESLQQRGHDVMVVSSDHGAADKVLRFSDVEFPEIDSPHSSIFEKSLKHLWYRPAHRKLKSVIAEFHPDIVHFHVMGQLSPSALFATQSVPSVLTVHGPEEYVRSIIQWNLPKYLFRNDTVDIFHLTTLGIGYYLYFCFVQRPLYQFGFRRHLGTMIAPSRYMADVLEKEKFKVPIRQIYNGINLPKYHPLQSHQRLLYVGRLEHVKGVDALLRAMPTIVSRIPQVELSIVGDGAMRHELESFVKQEHLENNVEFCGWLDGDAVLEKYAETTIVVIPSIWPENLPTVCIEALAIGRPVVGTRSGGIPELINDGVTGRIVPKGNAKKLADGIIEMLSQPDLETVAELCALSMRDFEIHNFVSNLEQLYEGIINSKKEKA